MKMEGRLRGLGLQLILTSLHCFSNLHGYLGHCTLGLWQLDPLLSVVTLVILLFIPGACLMLIRPSTRCCLQLCALESTALSKDHIGGLKLNSED